MNYIKKLKVYEYEQIDGLSVNKKIGLIAQDVDNDIESIVASTCNYIPNIMTNCVCLSHNQIKLLDKTEISANKNDKILVYDLSNNDKLYMNIQQINYKDGIVTLKENDQLTINNIYFLYGTLIDDFKSIDYSQIICYLIQTVQKLINKDL